MKSFEISPRRTLVVVGNGMVGHKLLEVLARPGGDRGVGHRHLLRGGPPGLRPGRPELVLRRDVAPTSSPWSQPGFFERVGLTVHVGDAVASIDPEQADRSRPATGRRIAYDALVLATGSYPFVPPLPGNDAPGCFVYRTLDDLEAIRDYADRTAGRARWSAAACSGLEAANALRMPGPARPTWSSSPTG